MTTTFYMPYIDTCLHDPELRATLFKQLLPSRLMLSLHYIGMATMSSYISHETVVIAYKQLYLKIGNNGEYWTPIQRFCIGGQ